MLSEALSYPTEDEDWIERFAIGSLVMFGTFAFSPLSILLNGYYLRVFEAARTDTPDLPEFDEWTDMAIDGLKLVVIGLLYAGIPTFLLFGTLFFAFLGLGIAAGGDSGLALGIVGLVALLVILVETVVWIAGSVMAPAAIGRMLETDDFESAFSVRTIYTIAKQRDFLVAVALAWTVGFAIAFVGVIFSILLVGIPILFYGALFSNHLLGQGYRLARETADID
jgi:hypothetical protein